ncbi:Riboflavin transporter FmnP [Alkalithermobacter thermoalcaliphilus JW-YL-7 = DSM 7308]|uniref:Riboflavin transporter n=1 Tax=Alkalithermobacter thermoalcaliphilus JW-YL-7 = DSM 7308 TaxID=1121328 RepID=A0A150FPX6_CLOPD|nr:ECF transporter, substrate-specific component [[Clostridium] paradoxum JW-YL-7 = DSM 7308]SHL06710.1 Riboflavin transporter FmnP [[Clostridium] paradoxum JW-YL-7 = DSM 7308]
MSKNLFAKKRTFTTSSLVKISILSVLSFLMMFIQTPLMFFPEFLKLDVADVPAVIGGFALGPLAGVVIQLVKNLLHFAFKTSTGGVGELANFMIGSTFVLVSSAIYHLNKTKKNAVIGCIVATFAMALVGGITNYYILIPFYSRFYPIEAIVAMSSAVNKYIVDLNTLIIYGIVPFNIIKGSVISIITIALYKRVRILIRK